MPKLYRSREGEASAVDTKTQLTTLGSETAPGALTVPAGASKLVGCWVAAMPDFAATGSASAFVRIEGPALKDGPESLTVAAFGVTIATGGQASDKSHYFPLDVEVIPTNEVQLFAEMAGADIGSIAFCVTLVFE